MIDKEVLDKLCINILGERFVFNDGRNPSFNVKIVPNAVGSRYCVHAGGIAFMPKNGGYYVSPFTDELRPLLEAAGYKEGFVEQPFNPICGPVSIDLGAKWFHLCEQKRLYEENKGNNITRGL